MQTFLPYESFVESAKCLDYKRLGNQRSEVKTILDINLGLIDSRWKNYPVVLMWKGYEESLLRYGAIICLEWKSRGYVDNILPVFLYYAQERGIPGKDFFNPRRNTPPWLGDKEFHLSHKSNLIRKDPEFYRPIFGNDIPDNLPYFWPVRKEKK